MMNNEIQRARREQMVQEQLITRNITDLRVLEAMHRVPRHIFLPRDLREMAYRDSALPIGNKQTISQPYIVALMTQMLGLEGHETVLEIGTGSGYQTAILCELAANVISIERHALLAGRAGDALTRLGYSNVEVYIGDGTQGLPDMAPYDAILVTAAAPALPDPLRLQLDHHGGRLVLPLGTQDNQHLERVIRMGEQWQMERTLSVRFVPLIGRYGFAAKPPKTDKDSQAEV